MSSLENKTYRSIFISESKKILKVYTAEMFKKLSEQANAEAEHIYTKEEILNAPDSFKDVKYIFSTWGMPSFTQEEIRSVFPSLRAVFYAAGSVQSFARPFLECGISVFSAWAANAVPVAEYTVAQIVLACKGYFRSSQIYKNTRSKKSAAEVSKKYCGNYENTVGLIGCGMIGSMVAERLKQYNAKVLAFDPFLSDERAACLNVEKCSLEELFSRSDVVSNHLANNERTQGMLRGEHFAAMPMYSTFINTGRGAQIVENELIRVLKERADITAVLDVTFPEPPLPESEFYTLDNVILTPHIAGSAGNEVHRMAEYMLEEFKAFEGGFPTRYSVTLRMLETMA